MDKYIVIECVLNDVTGYLDVLAGECVLEPLDATHFSMDERDQAEELAAQIVLLNPGMDAVVAEIEYGPEN